MSWSHASKLIRLMLTKANKYHALQWRHCGRDGVSNYQPHDCLHKRLFRCRSKKTSKLRVTGLCAGNSSVTGEFSAQMASNAENASIWWRHNGAQSSQFHQLASSLPIDHIHLDCDVLRDQLCDAASPRIRWWIASTMAGTTFLNIIKLN